MSSSDFRRARREFLRRTSVLGLAGAVPPWLSSCDGNDAGPTAAGPLDDLRETRPLHLDLSLAGIVEPRLMASRSRQHQTLLTEHTAQSRMAARATLPALAAVDDARLTHYVEAVDLPAAALQTLWVMGRHPATGAPVLGGAFISVPRSAQASVAKRAAAAAAPARSSAKALAYQTRPTVGLPDAQNDGLDAYATPFDTAVCLVFHHPEVMNLDPDLGAEILRRIGSLPCADGDANCTPYVGTLAFRIATLISTHGYPTTTPGSWATLVPLVDADGKPYVDEKGQPRYSFELQADVATAVGGVVQQVLKDIFDDPLFKGSNWHETTGLAHESVEAPQATALAAAVDAAFAVSATRPSGSTFSGMRMVDLAVTDTGKRSVRMSIKNDYLRFVGVFVQYLDSQGTILPVEQPDVLDGDQSKFLHLMSSNNQIMGIPFQGGDVATTRIEFSFPPEPPRP